MPQSTKEPGRFITFEGGEGAGKSTQARHLAAALRAVGILVVSTREPGGTPGAERLRELLLVGGFEWSPLAETMLHFAARAEHVDRVVRPALLAGTWVVSDRYADSTMVYQGHGQGADRDAIAALTAMLRLRPDLTVVLDVPVAASLARLAGRGGDADRYERLGAAFFTRVAEGFRAVAAADPTRCVLLNGEGAEMDIAAEILGIARARLGLPA